MMGVLHPPQAPNRPMFELRAPSSAPIPLLPAPPTQPKGGAQRRPSPHNSLILHHVGDAPTHLHHHHHHHHHLQPPSLNSPPSPPDASQCSPVQPSAAQSRPLCTSGSTPSFGTAGRGGSCPAAVDSALGLQHRRAPCGPWPPPSPGRGKDRPTAKWGDVGRGSPPALRVGGCALPSALLCAQLWARVACEPRGRGVQGESKGGVGGGLLILGGTQGCFGWGDVCACVARRPAPTKGCAAPSCGPLGAVAGWTGCTHGGGLQLSPPPLPNLSPLPPPRCVPPKGWGETAGVRGPTLGDVVTLWVLLSSRGGGMGHPHGPGLRVNRIWSRRGAGGGGGEG